jgi:hypothetical protein
MSDPASKTILILAANPRGTTQLRLSEEVREIRAGLLRPANRTPFKLESCWAVRPLDLQPALHDSNPHIVHFSGHGLGESTSVSDEPSRKLNPAIAPSPEGIVFEDSSGNISLASTTALANLFSLFKGSIQCVVLNACCSENQAKAIAQHIPYVIGMKQAIGDRAAIAFSIGFYVALGAGCDIPFAFDCAKNAIELENIPEHLTPVLFSGQSSQIVSATPKQNIFNTKQQPQRSKSPILGESIEKELLRLNYKNQARAFRRFREEERIGAFLIHGEQHHGQVFLVKRLLNPLPDSINRQCATFSGITNQPFKLKQFPSQLVIEPTA